MGFQVQWMKPTGEVYTNAYANVSAVGLEYGTKTCRLLVHIWFDKNARDNGMQFTDYAQYLVNDLTGKFTEMFGPMALSIPDANPQVKAYEYLKSLPEFAGAIEV